MINLNSLTEAMEQKKWVQPVGKVMEVRESFIKCKGPLCRIGDLCLVGEQNTLYEVIALENHSVVLVPLKESGEIRIGDRVQRTRQPILLPEAENLLGRTINALGEPIDGLVRFKGDNPASLEASPPSPMERRRIAEPVETGVKAIDALLTIGRGQKIGLFAGSGVGKSTLMGMIARKSKEDVNVIALVGERGREVKEFIDKELGEEGLKRSIVVVSTSDEGPLLNMKAAWLATSIAEQFRDRGRNVLLMMDSVTRFASARRVYDIATGDIPVAGGKTLGMEPSMQKLLERAGNSKEGSITGIYTVLVENDDFNGVIPDTARGILDGHIALTRKLADQGHFPAIDILGSISRVMQDVVAEEHWSMARMVKKYAALYQENEELFKMDLIETGQNLELDRALYCQPFLQDFLKQDIKESFAAEESVLLMKGVIQHVST